MCLKRVSADHYSFPDPNSMTACCVQRWLTLTGMDSTNWFLELMARYVVLQRWFLNKNHGLWPFLTLMCLQEILLYHLNKPGKFLSTSASRLCLINFFSPVISPSTLAMSTDDMPSDLGFHVRSQFKLIWQRSFAHPIHQVWYGDLTHDGLSELAIISMGGVHILQVSCFSFC